MRPPQPARPTQRIRCLVIQLARLGDTLQSLMALRAAKQLYPELEIHLVVRERFSGAAKRVPWIDRVITLPTEALLGPVLNGEKFEKQGIGDVARWITPLIEEPWDFVVNWSYSEASSYLTGLMPSRVKLGFTRRKDISFYCTDGWSHYIQAIVQGGVHQNIHLTDILTTQLLTSLQIHVGEPVNAGNATVSCKGFFNLELTDKELNWGIHDPSRKWIAIQLGAGQNAKTWSPENWAKMASYVLDRHLEHNIVLLGGKEDEKRAARFLSLVSQPKRVVSLVGDTSFSLWASVVGRCQWVFAGDTAAIHLASVLGTRVFNISVGPVRWSETGPYGNGHYVISSNVPCKACDERNPRGEHSCRNDIKPEAAYGAWSYANGEWAHRRQLSVVTHFARLGWDSLLDTIRIHRSKIRNTSDGGGVVYEPSIPRPLPLRDWRAMVMGHTARAWYCGWVPKLGQDIPKNTISPQLVQSLRQLDESAAVMLKICEQAMQYSILLNRRSSAMRSDKIMEIEDREQLRDLGMKLMDLDQLVERLAAADESLQPFAQMAKVLMHNLKGTHLSDLGRESADAYRQLSEGIKILREWISYTLNLAKPVAVKQNPALTEDISK